MLTPWFEKMFLTVENDLRPVTLKVPMDVAS